MGVLKIPEGVENIAPGAFAIVCEGTMPAYVQSGAFDGVSKDNFTLEVPESAVHQYQAASGWCDFKRIAAHHELVCRPSVACALNSQHKQTLTINAEGEWEVASKPDWCDVTPSSGTHKTEVTLTVKSMAKGSANREPRKPVWLRVWRRPVAHPSESHEGQQRRHKHSCLRRLIQRQRHCRRLLSAECETGGGVLLRH